MHNNGFQLQKKKPKPLKTLARVQNRSRRTNGNSRTSGARPSERPDAHEIVKVHDSNHLATLDDQERLDFVADQLERLCDQRIGRDRAGAPGHDRADRRIEGEIRLQVTAQIAVSDDTGEAPPLFENRDAAETLRRHLDDRLRHPGVRVDARQHGPRCA